MMISARLKLHKNKSLLITTVLLFLLILIIPYGIKAQTLGLKFEGIGDNREFFSRYSQSETIFGSRITLDLGTTVDSVHQVRAGLIYFYEFGGELPGIKPKPVLYYSFDKGPWQIRFGSMPRNEVQDYPLAIISDRFGYYRPTFEGLRIGYQHPNLSTSLWADWISRQDTLNREQFMAGFTGAGHLNDWFLNVWGYMFHNAHRLVRWPDESIEDNLGGLFQAGYDFSSLVPIDKLTVSTGMLFSMFRNRGEGKTFTNGASVFSQLEAAYRGYGLSASYNRGGPHRFTHGDPFYLNTTNYMRIGLFFTPINHSKIKGQFTWSLHLAHGKLDNQQQFSLVYLFNSNLKHPK